MTRHELLYAIARRLAAPGESISMADHAALRRMDPTQPAGAANAAFRLLAAFDALGSSDEETERWILLIHTLALARGGHDAAVNIGTALVGIRFGEARLQQLLSADWPTLRDLLPRLARRFATQQQRADFAPLMRLVMTADRHSEEADKARLLIARSFVQAQHKADHEEAQTRKSA